MSKPMQIAFEESKPNPCDALITVLLHELSPALIAQQRMLDVFKQSLLDTSYQSDDAYKAKVLHSLEANNRAVLDRINELAGYRVS